MWFEEGKPGGAWQAIAESTMSRRALRSSGSGWQIYMTLKGVLSPVLAANKGSAVDRIDSKGGNLV